MALMSLGLLLEILLVVVCEGSNGMFVVGIAIFFWIANDSG